MTKKISAILMGGLGNYMFQIAVAYAYAKRYEMSVGFNCAESSGPHKHITEYDNNVLKKVDLYHVRDYKAIQHNETSFNYQPIPKYDNNVLLYGYFQSEKYFKDYENDIRELFMSYDIELSNEINNILTNHNTCSIHVRRGDYLKYPDHHPTQTVEYYTNAIHLINEDAVFLVFSDDIGWCKEHFKSIPRNFKFIEGYKDYEDLYIMSKCNDNIIANSTFSWWGAWLNNNQNKKVIAPKKWFGPLMKNNNTDDLYCEGWIKI